MSDTILNAVNETLKAGGTKESSPQGMVIAYLSLTTMALLPILLGSYRSVRFQKNQKESGEEPDTLTSKDAAMFPLIASLALLSLYIIFKIFSQEYINFLLTGYFFILGIIAVSHILAPQIKFIDAYLPFEKYHLKLGVTKSETYEEISSFVYHYSNFISIGIASAFGVWYMLKKHWIANDLLGLAFALNGIEILQLNTVVNGCILLGGLFFYDVFWVFGTDVMVTVAKSFEAPIKLVFPQDIITNGLAAQQFAMLGLGDIVIPGVFIALLLRFDTSLKRKVNLYFWTCFAAYLVGLIMTIGFMYYFKHPQPALLYLVPCCLGFPLMVALLKGDLSVMFKYKDQVEEEESAEISEDAKNKSD